MNTVRLRRTWLAPLLFFQAYLSLAILIFFFGPWPWDVTNPTQLAGYLILAQFSIFIGYILSWPTIFIANKSQSARSLNISVNKSLRFAKQSIFISLLLIMPTSLSRTGLIFPDVVNGLKETGLAYNDNLFRLDDGNTYQFVEYLRILFSPWLLSLLPLTVVFWSRLSSLLKLGSVIAISYQLLIYISIGTNKIFADLIISFPWFIYLGYTSQVLHFKISKYQLISVFFVIGSAFSWFFVNGQLLRDGNVATSSTFNSGMHLINANSSPFLNFLPYKFVILYESLTRYLVHGYYALSLSFQFDITSTLGLGHSLFLARNADRLFDTDFFTSQSLPGILEAKLGWSHQMLWHSIYTWLASDFGFTGSIFIIGLFSYLLATSWGMALCTLKSRWIVMFSMMLILFYYIPGNNQIFQSGESCIGFFIFLILLVLPRRRENY